MSLQYWLPMDKDASQKGANAATITENTATHVSEGGKFGGCYSFNGSNSYLLSDTGFMNNNVGDFSYACWFKPNSAHNGCLFSSRTQVNTTGIALFYYTSQFLFDDGVRWTLTPSTMPTVGQWNHICFVRKKGVGKYYYLNGVLIASTASTGTPSAAGPAFSIGCSQTSQTAASGNALNGYLNDVRIYDHALTQEEISRLAGIKPPGLQVWLPLTHNILNQGLSKLEFSNLNGSFTAVNAAGKLGSCYKNTSWESGGLVSNITIDLGQNQTMACWFKFDSLTSNSSLGGSLITQHRYPNNSGMGLTLKYVSSTTGYLSVNTGNGSERTFNTYCGTTLLQAGKWYHGAYTYDGSNIRIYVNGNLELTQPFTGMSVPADYIAVFCWAFGSSGSTPYGNYKLNGSLNDVRVYNKTLTSDEIKKLAKGLSNRYLLTKPAPKVTLQYDKNLYTEPDGSVWARVVHHNNPAGGLFASSDTFSTGVYKDANRWYDLEAILADPPSLEFMVKQKTTSDATEAKYRWVQYTNPL